ncbi:MAG: FecR domain-containing protein [Prolixibacteraceae bacterium]|jgi:ferric-dicitrate binding protein FerR (iron transport regulator)
MKENFKYLIENYAEGKLSLTEQIELSEQIADEQNVHAEQVLHNDFQQILGAEPDKSINLNPVLDRVHHQIHKSESQKVIRLNFSHKFQRVAAILIVPLLLSFMAYLYFQPNPFETNSFAEIQCPMGARIKFELPDGSVGFLNSGSNLRYPVQFTDERSVELKGEAYFEVVQNQGLPFHVNTKNLDIKVLGTTFNVIANDDEATEEVILQTGKVDVSTRSGKELGTLKPNEQMTLDLEKRICVLTKVEASQYTGWTEGKLILRNENMQQVARRLSRWYNAEVVVADKQLDRYTFHATFIDESIDEVLKLLSITTPLNYKEEKRESDTEGVFQKRKIVLRINQSKINQFR